MSKHKSQIMQLREKLAAAEARADAAEQCLEETQGDLYNMRDEYNSLVHTFAALTLSVHEVLNDVQRVRR